MEIMEIEKTEHQHIFRSEDYRGVFEIRIHNDFSQIQFATEVDEWSNEDHANINRKELMLLRDMLNQLLDKESNSHQTRKHLKTTK